MFENKHTNSQTQTHTDTQIHRILKITFDFSLPFETDVLHYVAQMVNLSVLL